MRAARGGSGCTQSAGGRRARRVRAAVPQSSGAGALICPRNAWFQPPETKTNASSKPACVRAVWPISPASTPQGKSAHRHRSRAQTRRSHGPRAALRPAGPGQNHSRLDHRAGTGRPFPADFRTGAEEEARPFRHPEHASRRARFSSSTRFTACCRTSRRCFTRRWKISISTFWSARARARARIRFRCRSSRPSARPRGRVW